MKFFIQLSIIFSFFMAGCQLNEEPEPHSGDRQLYYFNSFESAADTAELDNGYAWVELMPDAPPEGGKKSLFISGGCIAPHASIKLNPLAEDGHFILRCWGKTAEIGGSVVMSVADDYPHQIGVFVQDSTWIAYETPDTLYCPAGGQLLISLSSGGFAQSSMLVDLLEVVKVD